MKVRIEPEHASRKRSEEMVQDVSRSELPEGAEIGGGSQFQAQGPGGTQVVMVVAVEGDMVKLDGNHPLAGMHLNFDVRAVEVREATGEELEHGHVHGPGGHEH